MAKQPEASEPHAPLIPKIPQSDSNQSLPGHAFNDHSNPPSPRAPPGPPPGPAHPAGPVPGQQPPHISPGQPHASDNAHHYRSLSPPDWAKIAHALGGIKDLEQQDPIHPRHCTWPPRGLASGLYRDVVSERSKFFWLYHTASILRWTLMIVQLLVGAALTAIGSMSMSDGVPITVLGAVNTVVAGFLALLTNSGLPDRYRYDMFEYAQVEDHIKEILNSGVVPANKTNDQVIAECFEMYQDAKTTVAANMPANYTSRQALRPGAYPSNVSGPMPTTSASGLATVKAQDSSR